MTRLRIALAAATVALLAACGTGAHPSVPHSDPGACKAALRVQIAKADPGPVAPQQCDGLTQAQLTTIADQLVTETLDAAFPDPQPGPAPVAP